MANRTGLSSIGQVVHSASDYALWMASFKDIGGNTIAIMDERGDLVG